MDPILKKEKKKKLPTALNNSAEKKKRLNFLVTGKICWYWLYIWYIYDILKILIFVTDIWRLGSHSKLLCRNSGLILRWVCLALLFCIPLLANIRKTVRRMCNSVPCIVLLHRSDKRPKKCVYHFTFKLMCRRSRLIREDKEKDHGFLWYSNS